MRYLPDTQNLYLSGLTPDGRPKTLVQIPGYWARQLSDQARGGRGDAFLPDLLGLMRERVGHAEVVVLDTVDNATGRVLERTITHNIVTDTGATNMLKPFANTAPALAPYLALDTASFVAVASSTIASGTATSSIPVNSVAYSAVAGNAATNPDNTTSAAPNSDPTTGGGLVWSYGTANAETVSGGSQAASPLTALAIASYTTAKAHNSGDNIVANPQTGDNPSAAPAGVVYSASSPAALSGTGIGNRQAQYTYTFGTATPAGNYTGLWVVTSTTWAAGVGLTHLSFPAKNINSSTSLQVVYSVRI